MLKEKSVLIVDDEKGVRQALKRGIHRQFNREENRVSISEASNGKEAIASANSFLPDLIIMDMRMPIMDGLKACRILRNDNKFSATKIMMLTCEISEEGAGLLSGADDYIIKPFDIKTLLIRIENSLFNQSANKTTAYIEYDGILTKHQFIEYWLDYEISRAQRFQHSLSLLMIKMEIIGRKSSFLNKDTEMSTLLKRRSSDLLIKWGENTFAILLIETSADDAILLAKRITWLAKKSPYLTLPSLGIANLEGTLNDDLIVNAEHSLAASISTGKIVLNRLVVNL
ncbi:response regulator [Colwellia psychrerythraea]|uniref:Response regulator receiver modulated diguanylate cyclase n=1 Tax=Colwellia psychrerythraea TaxID=28229 RepID=A0A099KT50_COLPS|nr:response regulator [Colwellia psychrerythraea]KGJ93022.1 response regulator receiver modulated diguanylate cyclase [Colwellia psychrerythraea]